MNKDLKTILQIDKKQISATEKALQQESRRLQTSAKHSRILSKISMSSPDKYKETNYNSRSQITQVSTHLISRDLSTSSRGEDKDTERQLNQTTSGFQLRKQVSNQVIRLSTSQFLKRKSNESNASISDPKISNLQQNNSSKVSKYFMTSRFPSQNQNQLKMIMDFQNSDKDKLTNKLQNESNHSQSNSMSIPMSLQYKKFQESFQSQRLGGSNLSGQFPDIISQNNNSPSSYYMTTTQRNSTSGYSLQKYFLNQSQQQFNKQQSINLKDTVQKSQYEVDESNIFINQNEDTHLHLNSPTKKLTLITKANQSPSQNYSSPNAALTNTTAFTFTSKPSIPSSPQINFFLTENPQDTLWISQSKVKMLSSPISKFSDQLFDNQNSPQSNFSQNQVKLKSKEINKSCDFKGQISPKYFSQITDFQDSILSENGMSQQEQLSYDTDNILIKMKSQNDEDEEEQKICLEKNNSKRFQDCQQDQISYLNENKNDKKSDFSLPFNKDSLLQNIKDTVYFQKIMQPLSSRSEIQKSRFEMEKPNLKFFQKLKKIEKIQEENEFDKVKIRNIDLETVVISNQLKDRILPLNLNRFYKENKIPQKTNKNTKISKQLFIKEQQQLSQSNDQINNITENQGTTRDRNLTNESNSIEQKSSESDQIQKKGWSVNVQGLQDEEKIKEMEEYLESDKFNETFYANNRKMGKPYMDIVTNILKQKKARRSLKQVFIKNNRINNDSLAQIVKNLPLSTRQLDLSYNQITHIGSKYVTELLNDNAFHNLEYLNLSKNMIGDIGAIKIFEATVSNNFLKVLDISQNKITNLSCIAVSQILSNNQYLEELYLGQNTIMNEGLKIICDGLQANCNLKVLDLQHNSLGGSSDPLKFYGKRLIKITNDKNSNMKHLDLSFNRFLKDEALEIAKELKDNFYLYGFHFEGNPCNFIVNARGFIVENKKPLDDQGRGMFQRNIRINDFQNVSEIYKNNFYKRLNTSDGQLQSQERHQKNQSESKQEYMNSCKSGEVCWICDGYKEIKFTFKLNYKIDREPVYIHLSFEGYEPFRMDQDPKDNTKFFINRMCPPDSQITYFFSNPFINQISILPYNQIRSQSNPMHITNQQRSIKSNKSRNSIQLQTQPSNILVVDYTDIKGYIIPLPFLMNIYKNYSNQNANDNTLLTNFDNSPQIDGLGMQNLSQIPNDTLDSSETLVQHLNQIDERKKEEYQTYINRDQFDKNQNGEIIYMYKKKLGNVLNDNYDPVIRSIIRQIQKPYLGQVQDNKGLKKNGWNVKNSVFAEFKGDDYLCLNNSFEFDWSQSKLNKMIKSEDDKEDLKQILYDIYPYLKNTYKLLASQNIYGEVFALSKELFSDLILQTKIVDGKLMKSSDVDFNFTATNAQKEKNPRNPEKALIRYQLMEVLVRIAFDKYIKNKTFTYFSEAFKQILNEEDLLNILMNSPDPQKWRETRLWTPQCDQLVKQKMESFKKLYEKWAGNRNREKKILTTVKAMSCYDFKDLLLSYSIFGDTISDKEQNQIFNDSIMTQIDEVNKDRHMQMQLIEFIEAFGRVADKLSPVPFGEDKDAYTKEELIKLPLHMKMESIIASIDGNGLSQIKPKNTLNSQAFSQKDFSMPKINSKLVLDQQSIVEIKDEDNKMPSQTKLGFKGFMLAKSLKKRLIGNKSLQPYQQIIKQRQNGSLEYIDENILK